MSSTSYKWIQLLTAISLSTGTRIKKVFFNTVVADLLKPQCGFPGDLLVQSALMLNGKENLLKEIHFRVPFPISLVAKGDKTFSVTKTTYDQCDWSLESCRSFLKSVVGFIGGQGGLLSLQLDLTESLASQEDDDDEQVLHFCQEVQVSRITIEMLDLVFNSDTNPNTIMDLVTALSSLTSLKVEYYQKEDGEQMISPRWLPSFNLKVLDLEFKGVKFERWDWLTSWCSNALETFNLAFDRIPSSSKIPTRVLSSILDSSSSLTSMELDQLFIINNEIVSSSPSVKILPNLVSLKVNSLNAAAYKLLSYYSMPRLRHLWILDTIKYTEEHSHNSFVRPDEIATIRKHFVKISENCSSSLVELNFNYDHPLTEDSNQEEIINFPHLKELNLSTCHLLWFNLFSKFHYPRLKGLRLLDCSSSVKSVFDIIRSSSSTLERVNFDEMELDGGFAGGEIDLATENLLLPNLKLLRITSSNAQFIDLFTTSTFQKLKEFSVQWSGNAMNSSALGGRLAESVFAISTSEASSTLEKLLLTTQVSKEYTELGMKGVRVDFTNLKCLDLQISCPQLSQHLSRSTFPQLSKLTIISQTLYLQELLVILRKSSKTLIHVIVQTKQFVKTELNSIVAFEELVEKRPVFEELGILRFCDGSSISKYQDNIELSRSSEFFGLLLNLNELSPLSADEKFSMFRKELAPKLRYLVAGTKSWTAPNTKSKRREKKTYGE